MSAKRLLGIGGLALAFAYFLIDINFPIHQWITEGVPLLGAQEILAGRLPYRDFATYAPPGIFYFLALVLRVFGSSLFWARFWTVVIPKTLIVLVIFKLARLLILVF